MKGDNYYAPKVEISVQEVIQRGISPNVIGWLMMKMREELDRKLADLESIRRVLTDNFTVDDIIKASAAIQGDQKLRDTVVACIATRKPLPPSADELPQDVEGVAEAGCGEPKG